MKEFLQLLRRFVPPYKKYLVWALFLNLLSAFLNIFSFTLIIPILQILFKMDTRVYEFIPWDTTGMGLKDVAVNNFYYGVSQLIADQGASLTLLILGVFLAVMTLLKTLAYFASSAVMIPLRTGVVRDIRRQVYNKVLRLPLAFFSEERKGDIIARMSGDVTEVETSVTSSLDMLIKNPILIIVYFATMIAVSWQLTVFTLLVVPAMGWVMGTVGKKLKRKSLEAQSKWSDTMSQLEETLGGLRIIKAFIAEKKMEERFDKCSNDYRDAINRVATRQALAHPMSEFLGTCLIVIVLWFGGTLILNNSSAIDAPSFIFYLVILYSVINPLKEFSKAGYNIPKGLASMERIDKILLAENPIKEPDHPKQLKGLEHQIEFRDISFSYDGRREVLKHVNLTVPCGRTIALVGQSGSGKSTLVDLLPRYHDVQQGEILIDGIDIRKIKISSLRRHFGQMLQDVFLFSDTVEGNIAFGDQTLTEDEVHDFARRAAADDFIKGLSEGYDTIIGERGVGLSGGQKQRIALARALAVKPGILVMDDTTSAVDMETEKYIQAQLRQLPYDCTKLIIAQRISSVKDADLILILKDGVVTERGTHQELLRQRGY